MEFGKHKTLDYLNLSLNLPLNYHDLSIYSTKYTKALHDFLRIKPNLKEVKSNEQKRKKMLKTLNSILYLNNHLHNRDANERDYKKTGVNFIKAHIGTKSMRGNNQQIMMINLKTVIKNLRKKYMGENDEAIDNEDESSTDSIEHSDEEEKEEKKIQRPKRRSSSINQVTRNTGIRRTLSRMAEGDDFEDYKQTQKMAEDSKKRINKPKVMNVKGTNASNSTQEKEFFEDNECSWPLQLMSLFHPFRINKNE